MMVVPFLYAHCVAIPSSRRIERPAGVLRLCRKAGPHPPLQDALQRKSVHIWFLLPQLRQRHDRRQGGDRCSSGTSSSQPRP